jgi:hypothetical protein
MKIAKVAFLKRTVQGVSLFVAFPRLDINRLLASGPNHKLCGEKGFHSHGCRRFPQIRECCWKVLLLFIGYFVVGRSVGG